MAAKALPLFYGLVFIILVLPILSVSDHGRYNIAFQAFIFIALLNKSLVLYPMLRFGADPDQYDKTIGAGFYLSIIYYLFFGAVIWIAAPLGSAILRVEVADLRLSSILLVAFFFRDFGFFVQQIAYRTARLFFIEATYWLGSAGGFVYLYLSRGNFEVRELLWVNIFAALASSVMSIILSYRWIIRLGGFDIGAAREIMKYGFYTLPIGLTSSIAASADVLILGAIYTPAVVGVYSGAKRVYQVLSALTQAAGLLILPYVSRLSSTDRRDEIRVLFEKTTVYIWLSLAALAGILWLSADNLYAFIGKDYAGAASILMILLIAVPFDGVYHVSAQILYGVGQARKVALVAFGSLIILLLLLTTGTYFFAQNGTAVALCTGLIIAGIWMYLVTGKEYDSGLMPSLKRFGTNLSAVVREITSNKT